MLTRLLLCILLAGSLASCATHKKKKDADKDKPPEPPTMADMSEDTTFQAFLGRLRRAVATHDLQTLAPMMTTNFGYRLNPLGEGDGVFQYWDDEILWPQVQSVLNQNFVPKGNFMVAPPEFANDPNFHGYRAGLTSVDGTWKFAYFVTD
ncbi:MAG TPA: hypothetical protein VHY22_11340 [Chthoniobacteraceae bacterium]|jgi:hypothetical protein|nr:hypothetical protein [Chthoniobacteraceae bacterium]